MIDHLSRWAQRLSWLRPVAGLALLLAAGWLGWVLLNQSGSEVGGRLLPSLVVLLWLLVLNAVLLTFPAVPARLEQGAGLIRRVINLLQRSLFSLLALLLLCASLAVLVLSWRYFSMLYWQLS